MRLSFSLKKRLVQHNLLLNREGAHNMKRILAAYKDLLSIIYAKAPVMVILTFLVSITLGLISPLSVFVNQRIFDGGLAVAGGEIAFSNYSVYLVLL